MNAQAFLEYVVAGAVIILAILAIGIGVGIALLIFEIRSTLRSMQQTVKSIEHLKERMSSGMIGSIVSWGKNLFQKRPHHD